MLTVHRGERDAYGAASAMARHLQQQTLPPGQDELLRVALGDRPPEARDQSAAVPRTDLDPRLAALLGVDPGRNLRHTEVVRLLAGRRADGAPVPGRPALRPTRTPGGALGLDPARPPDKDELRHLLAGRRADGSNLAAADTRGVKRLLGLFGIPPGHAPTPGELSCIGIGQRLDGSALSWRSASRFLFAPRLAVSYVGLCFSAHKSVSLAWAMAPIPSEAALIVQSQRDAVAAALLQVEAEVGRARRGRGGAGGHDPGPILWIQFHHYTARPTPGGDGGGENGAGQADPAGSPQLHTHVAIPNVTITADGHVGALDLQRLNGRLKEFGALYQARVATALRELGADVGLDPETGAAVLLGVSAEACRAFSRRTAEGTRAAQRYAERIGLDWDGLTADRRTALIKNGTQGDPRSPKSDDVADWAAWRHRADAIGWRPEPLLRPDQPVPLRNREERIRIAHEVASGLLRDALVRTGSLGEAETRTAAARGLVAAGIGAASDLDAVVQRIAQAGVKQEGAAVPLAWSTTVDAYGQAWGRLAVARDIGITER
ncbi:MAG: relaxase domain-containing protein, partial [Pseudomonadota bacterium]|nr:relaxase domain-containing protein [Pseudomonadota bacterium]